MTKPWLTLMVFLLVAPEAFGHRLSPAYLGLNETTANEFAVQWKVSISGGLAETLSPRFPEGCEVAGIVRRYVVEDAQLQHATVTCDGPLAGRVFAVNGLASTDTDVLLQIDTLDGRSFTHRLVPERPSVVIPESPGALDTVATYTRLGVEHILFGFDHLLFVFALLLLVPGWKRLALTVTAFTAAHSITLAAASLGVVNVAVAPVEATIALSILFLATELARRADAGSSSGGRIAASVPTQSLTTRFPWLVAFAFGLLHGFGFAGALAELGLPQEAIPLALLFFNLGVEFGQLLFIAAVLGIGLALRPWKRELPAWSPRLTAYVIGSVAAFWVLERTLTAV